MKSLVSLALAGLVSAMAHPALAGDRYVQRPPVVLSPDLSAPWVMQLGGRAPCVLAPACKDREVRI